MQGQARAPRGTGLVSRDGVYIAAKVVDVREAFITSGQQIHGIRQNGSWRRRLVGSCFLTGYAARGGEVCSDALAILPRERLLLDLE